MKEKYFNGRKFQKKGLRSDYRLFEQSYDFPGQILSAVTSNGFYEWDSQFSETFLWALETQLAKQKKMRTKSQLEMEIWSFDWPNSPASPMFPSLEASSPTGSLHVYSSTCFLFPTSRTNYNPLRDKHAALLFSFIHIQKSSRKSTIVSDSTEIYLEDLRSWHREGNGSHHGFMYRLLLWLRF